MVVTCPKCSTSYEFDETLVGPKGTVVRCTQCSHMFKIFADESDDSLSKAGWMVRKRSGKVFGIDKFSTVQKWIREGKIAEDDELSRTGKNWKKLGEIVELQKLFVDLGATRPAGPPAAAPPAVKMEVVPRLSIQADDSLLDSVGVSRTRAAPAPVAQVAPASRAASPRVEHRPPEPQVRYDAPEPEEGTVKGPLARSLSTSTQDDEVDESDNLLMPGYRPGRWKTVVLLVVLLVLAAAGGVGYWQRGSLLHWLSGIRAPATEGDREKSLERAHEYLLLDTGSYFDQAERILRDLLDRDEQDPDARAGLAELLAVRAQYARDRKGVLASPAGVEDPGTLVREAEKLAKLALLAAPDSLAANRAMADVLRLSGDLEEARTYIDKALDVAPRDPEALYIAVLIDLEDGMEPGKAIEDLARIARRSSTLLRVRFRLALMYALSGDTGKSRDEAEAILDINPDHLLASRLLEMLEKGGLTAAGPADAEATAEQPDAPGEDASTDISAKAVEQPSGPAGEPGAPKPDDRGDEDHAPAGGVPSGKSYDFYIGKAVKLQQSGSCDEAFDYFEKALQVNPQSTEAHSGAGYCYLSKGQYAPAVSSYKHALDSNKNYLPAIIGMAQAQEKKGNVQAALEYYKRYLDVNGAGPQAALARNKVKQLEATPDGGSTGGAGEQPDGNAPAPLPVVETGTEVEIKSSPGQPTGDTPTTAGDPYH